MNSNALRARASSVAVALPLVLLSAAALLLTSTTAAAQTPGAIYSPASGPSPAALNPNQDGWVTRSGAAFSSDDSTESEIPYFAIPQYGAEPTGDADSGGSGGPTDMVDTTATTHQASFVYWDKGADGQPDTADDKLLFRIRLGSDPTGAYGFSILIDTDARFGASGPAADPNAVTGNPGFEAEIMVATGGLTPGVSIKNVDGTTNGSSCASYGLMTNSMRSYALTSTAGTQNVFLDFFVPLRQLTTCLGITSTTRLRLVAATSTSPTSALGGNASDIGGVPDNDLSFQDNDVAFFQAVASSPAVTFNALVVGAAGFDTTAPETTIDSAPMAMTNQTTATFTFSANETGSTFECRLDGAASFSACTSPADFAGLADGPHTLEVRAIDLAGNVEPTPATWSWTIDTTAPALTVDVVTTVGPSALFSGTSEPVAVVTLTIDSAIAFTAAADMAGHWSWISPSPLPSGHHILFVRTTDAAGNLSEVGPLDFTVDADPPDTLIVSGPAAEANSSSATFQFSSTKPGSTFECSRDSAAFAACTNPVTLTGFADGSHTFAARAVDSGGAADPSPATWSWHVDTVAPDTSITSAPAAATNLTGASFTFASNEPSVTFECRLDGAPFGACPSPTTFTSLGEGSHTLEVRARDAAGNADPSPATFSWKVDTLAPDTLVLIGPAPVSGSASAGFQFGSNEAGVLYECSLDSAAFAPCSNPAFLTSLGDGPHTLQVRARDAAGNTDSTPAVFNWLVDTVAPDTTIATGPAAVSNSNTAVFTLTSNEAGVSFECRIDGWPFNACTSPVTFLGLSDGLHALQGRARDAAGNVDPTPAAWSWTIDTTAPDTSILSGPAPVTNAGTVTFNFSSNETGVTFECSFDSGPFQSCTDPANFTALGDGPHTLSVRARDAAGNVDATPAQFAWTLDRVPPDTTIVSGPAGTTGSTSASFLFNSDEAGASFECRLDSGAFAGCSNPAFLTGLTDGSHTLDVRARDAAGNVDATPASYGWIVDLGAPDTTILSGPSLVTTSTSASFDFASNELGTVFECRLDGGAFSPCTAPRTYLALADGGHTFEVRARDGAGNYDPTPATFTWTIDTLAPETYLVSGPPALSNSRAATFGFTSNEASASYECRLDGAAFAACPDPMSYAGLADGNHLFEVRARDAAGNLNPTPTQYGWRIDATAPETSILSGPSLNWPSTAASFDLDSNEAAVSYECSLDGGAFLPCADPAAFAGLGDGPHTLRARARDAAGNVDATPAAWSFTVDTLPPQTTIIGGPASPTNATSATLSFTSNEAGASFECSLDGSPLAPCTSPIAFVGLAEGPHSLAARAKDLAGNVDPTPAILNWTVDTTAPDTSFVTTPPAISAQASATFDFSATEASTFECKFDGTASFIACSRPLTLLALADGSHTLQVRARDLAGNVDATPASYTWTVDTSAPDTSIVAGPAGITNATGASFTFSSTEGATASYECSLDGAAFAPCANPASLAGLGEGSHSLQVRAKDAAGNVDPTPASRSWTVDLTPPETTLNSGPATPTRATSASFTFSSNEPGATFECSLDGASFVACLSPLTLTSIAEGNHTLQIRAKDVAGNLDPTPAMATWSVDLTSPETTLLSGPAATTASTSATFTFSSSEPGSTFECRLDGAAFGPCASPLTLTGLGEGSHTFEVRAKDAVGNVDPTPAAASWTIDLTAPDTSIVSGPAAVTNATSASFTLSATEAAANYECSLDGAPFAPCANPATFSGLGEGSHTLQARAKDAAGNVDPTPAARSWTIDLTAPDTTLLTGPTSPTRSTSATFTFSSNEAGAAFECSLDGAAFAACAAPLTLNALGEGNHTLQIRAKDVAGNVDPTPAASTWTVDLTAPETTLLSGPATATTNATTATFTFSASEPGSTFECKLDAAAFGPCTTPLSLSGLAEGSHTFQVRAVDAAGNLDPTPATQTWTVDLTAPETTILTGPAPITNATAGTFTFSATEPGSSFECALDGGGFGACTTPSSFAALSEGSHTFQVRAKDAAGNTDATPASFTWTVDLTAPETSIVSTPPALTNATSATFDFSSTVASASFECKLDGGSFAACVHPVTYAALGDGSHTIQVRAKDVAGNVDATPAIYTWTVDTTAPDTTITSNPAALVGVTSATFDFGATDASATFECKLDGAATFTVCTHPITYSALADGSHTFQVRAKDAAGNVDPTPATFTWTVDTTAPETTLVSGPAALTNATSASFSFSSTETGATFECALDGGSFAACATPASYSGLAEGSHTFQVRAKDGAGNVDATPASQTWTIDTTAPDTTLVSTPASPTSQASATFDFSSSETGSTFECKLDSGAFAACTHPATFGPLADGSHTLQVRAKDAAGNLDPTPASFTWTIDTAAPDTTILTGPAALVAVASASFTFSASETGASFECKLDGGSFGACTSPAAYSSLGEGNHTLQVRSKDAAGNVDPTPASWTWTVDTVAPETTIVSGPVTPTNATSATFDLSSNETGVTYECQLDGAAAGFTACADPATFTGLADGPHTLQVRARDAAGNADATPATYAWTVDTTAPDTTITTAPASLTNATAASFEFSASEAGATFECKLDGAAAFTPCTSPASFSGLADGSHTFQVRAKDTAGNVDPMPATHTWTVDATAPDTTIVGSPASPTNATSATFSFSSNESGVTYECKLDSAGSFTPCANPATFNGLADGSHTLQVRAKDAAGNVDAPPATHTWTVDATAPLAPTIAVPVDGSALPSGTVTIIGHAEANARVTVTLDGTALTPVAADASGAWTLAVPTTLADGAHTASAVAADAAGNVSPSSATTHFTVDTAAPDTTIVTAPAARTASASANFAFASNEPAATFECSLDGAPFAPCAAATTLTALADGAHTMRVRARDAAGNADATPASHTWTVDTTAPTAPVITEPSEGAALSTATPTVRGTAEAGTTVEITIDGASIGTVTADTQGRWSLVAPNALAEGAHTAVGTATDDVGNRGPASTAVHFTVLTAVPAAPVIEQPADGAFLNDSTPEIRGHVGAAGLTVIVSIDGVEAGTVVADPNGAWTFTPATALVDGAHAFSAVARSASGVLSTPSATVTVTIDTRPPETTSESQIDSANERTQFTFGCDEQGCAFECSLDGGAYEPCTSPLDRATALGAQHVFEVRALDRAGNVDPTPAHIEFTVVLDEESLRGAGCGCSSASTPSPWLPILAALALAFVPRRRGSGARRQTSAVVAATTAKAAVGVAAAIGLAAVLLPSATARAQQQQVSQLPRLDLERLSLNPDGMHSLVFGHGDVLPEGQWRASIVGDYEHRPLTYYRNDAEHGVLVSRRLTAHLLAAWAPIPRLEIGLQLPIILNQAGDDLSRFGITRPSSAGLGTPMLQARYGVLSTRAGQAFDLAAQLGVRTPLGSVSALGRDGSTGLEIKAGANRRFGMFDAGLQLGTLLRQSQKVVGNSGKTLLDTGSLFDLGATVAYGEEDGARAEIDLSASVGSGSSSAGEVLAGGRVPVGPVEIFALAGPGLGQYPGTPAFRVLGGVGLRAGSTAPAPAPAVVAERTEEAAATPSDRDGDGIADGDDACPDVPGVREHKGCPAPTAVATSAEPEKAAEPPAADATAETKPAAEEKVAEAEKASAAKAGPAREQGERVHFALNSARLNRESKRALDAVIEALKADPRSGRIVIEGHCDSTGPREYNNQLSKRRAEAVRAYLARHGVTTAVETVGYGFDRPVDTNETAAGRRRNRRAEFNATTEERLRSP